MRSWGRRLRGAIGMGLTWAVAWGVGGLLLMAVNRLVPGLGPFFRIFDAPAAALAIPGFVAGALFSVVLSIAGRGRRFRDLSLPWFTLWGALGGLLLALVPAAMVLVGLANMGTPGENALWHFTAAIIPYLTVMGAASAAGYLKLARITEDRMLESGDDVPEISGS